MQKKFEMEILLDEIDYLIDMGVFTISIRSDGRLDGLNQNGEKIFGGVRQYSSQSLGSLLDLVRLSPQYYPVYLAEGNNILYDPIFSNDSLKLALLLLRNRDNPDEFNNSLSTLQRVIEKEVPRIKGSFKLSRSNPTRDLEFICTSRNAAYLVKATYKFLQLKVN